jgi:UDP-N-acetylmuramyl pentapeptide phosphotransferase/UDP-N-acetylglucosamine-1-phosphate transferase
MHALPLVLALTCAAAMAPALLRALSAGTHTKANYRGRELPFPLGVLVLAAAAIALVPLELLQRLASAAVLHPEVLPIALYALGVIALGLLDDVFGVQPPGNPQPRGWRGHGAAALRGELTTGVVKAVGSLGLALLAMSYLNLSSGRWLLAAAVLVLATHLFNLLDLRPGRSIKLFVLVGGALIVGSGDTRPLWSLGLFAGPALVAGFCDLRERGMLGDSGASLLGALAGLWLVLTLSGIGQLVALGLLAAVTVYGELRSISELVERTPGLRELDSWGRPS